MILASVINDARARPPAPPSARSSVGASSLYNSSTQPSNLMGQPGIMSTNQSFYLAGNTASSGITYASAGNGTTAAGTALFKVFVDTPSAPTPIGQNGYVSPPAPDRKSVV